MRRRKIINTDHNFGRYDSNEDAPERYTADMVYLTPWYECGKCMVIIWVKDAYLDEPHIHIIDKATMGNKINGAYSMNTGKLVKKHGSMIGPVPPQILGVMRKALTEPDNSRWEHAMMEWRYSNKKYRLKINPVIPKFTNK